MLQRSLLRQLKASNYEVSTINYFHCEWSNNSDHVIINILLVDIIKNSAS